MKLTIYIVFATSILFCSSKQKENKAVVKQKKTIELPITQSNLKTDRDSIISFAKEYIGVPYVYAGNDPKKGFDCSGFVSFVFKNFDINLPRSSSGYKNLGAALSPEDFKIGDVLVFYGYKDKSIVGHLGIICEADGMHSKFIHASSGKILSVTISELDSEHYTNRFYKCIDVVTK